MVRATLLVVSMALVSATFCRMVVVLGGLVLLWWRARFSLLLASACYKWWTLLVASAMTRVLLHLTSVLELRMLMTMFRALVVSILSMLRVPPDGGSALVTCMTYPWWLGVPWWKTCMALCSCGLVVLIRLVPVLVLSRTRPPRLLSSLMPLLLRVYPLVLVSDPGRCR